MSNDLTQRDEIDCMKNILECLGASLKAICHFVDEQSITPSNLNDNFVSLEEPIGQTEDCFNLAVTLLASDTSPERIKTLVFENNAEFVATLLTFLTIGVPEKLNESNAEKLTSLKVNALKTLTKFVTICTNDNATTPTSDDEQKQLTKLCINAIVDEQGLDALFKYLQNSENEQVRLAIIEVLFVFSIRNEIGKFALVVQRGIPVFMNCLVSEKNSMIRLHICAILREFCNAHADELIKDNIFEFVLKVINIDSSSDVRAMATDILDSLLKSDKRAIASANLLNMAKVLAQRLLKDQSRDVLEAICRLLETIFVSKNQAFIEKFILVDGWSSFIRCLKSCSVRPASLAVRAMRFMLQCASPDLNLSFKITSHFPSLSVLLKAALEQAKNNQQNISQKLLKVELAVCLGLLFSQNPLCRQHVYAELKAFPLWMSTLRTALLGHLSFAEVEYFTDVVISDVTSTNLTTSVSKDSPHNTAIKELFENQEERFISHLRRHVAKNKLSFFDENGDKKILEDPIIVPAESSESMGKTKSFILSYAIHTTFEPTKQTLATYAKYTSILQGEELLQEPSNLQQITTPLLLQDSTPVISPTKPTVSSSAELVKKAQQLLAPMLQQQQQINLAPAPKPQQQRVITAPLSPVISNLANNDGLSPKKSPKPDKPRRPTDNHYTLPSSTSQINNNLNNTQEPESYNIAQEDTGYQPVQQFFQEDEYITQYNTTSMQTTDVAASMQESSMNDPIRHERVESGTQTPNFEKKRFAIASSPARSQGVGASAMKPKASPRVASAADTKLDRDLTLAKKFALYYMKHLLPNPVNRYPLFRVAYLNSNDNGLVLRKQQRNSPQKLIKTWENKDVRENELFTFDIPFESVTVPVIEQVISRAIKHSRYIKKTYITCPNSANAKGRRVFLLDMLSSIMPNITAVLEQLLMLVKETGEEDIKLPLYLWKGKERPDKSISHLNILEIIEYIRVHMAKAPQEVKAYEHENEFANNMEAMLRSLTARVHEEEISDNQVNDHNIVADEVSSSPMHNMSNEEANLEDQPEDEEQN